MIASLHGIVREKTLDSVILEVSGVGYRVLTTPETLSALSQDAPATLLTELIVKDDGLTLFGFRTHDERELFILLQKVSGIGARLALGMLTVYEPAALIHHISEGNVSALQKIPKVGKKTAQRLVLELKDAMSVWAMGTPSPIPAEEPQSTMEPQVEQVVEALSEWGYSPAEAEKTATQLYAGDPTMSASDLLRRSLVRLGRLS